MFEFKDARVEDGRIILSAPMTEDRFRLFCKNLYGSKIPIYKPVGLIFTHATFLNPADSANIDDMRIYEFIAALNNYIPVSPKALPGSYTSQNSYVDFDVSVKDRADFRRRAFVHGRYSKETSTMSPFDSTLDMRKVIQVFARIERNSIPDDAKWIAPTYNDIPESIRFEHTTKIYNPGTNEEDEKLGNGIFVPERLRVHYKDFHYYGYDTFKLGHKDNPMCLVNDDPELLFKASTRLRNKTPIIVCYKGVGEMNAGSITKELFSEPIAEFMPFEHVRFNISNYINVNMSAFRPGSTEIPIIAHWSINNEALETILRDYGEEE